MWQRACGVHTEHGATSWSFSERDSRNKARAYSLMACSSRILEREGEKRPGEVEDGRHKKCQPAADGNSSVCEC